VLVEVEVTVRDVVVVTVCAEPPPQPASATARMAAPSSDTSPGTGRRGRDGWGRGSINDWPIICGAAVSQRPSDAGRTSRLRVSGILQPVLKRREG